MRSFGSSLARGSAILWGVSGTFAQFLFQQRSVDTEWLVTIRLLVAGFLLLCIAKFVRKQKVIPIWRSRTTALKIFSFGIFGMLAVQYTYFAAIRESNAATATILQYLGPVFIVAYYAWVNRRVPKSARLISTRGRQFHSM